MDSKIIDGTDLSAQIKAEVKNHVKRLKSKMARPPGLSVVLVGDDPASAVYVRNKQRAAKEAGMIGNTIAMPHSSTEDEIIQVVK